MAARPPAKSGYPVGKVAFIEGYKHVNNRPSMYSPPSPRKEVQLGRHSVGKQNTNFHQRGFTDLKTRDELRRLSSVASASGIDPRLISLYEQIEACVSGIQAIKVDLANLLNEEEFQI